MVNDDWVKQASPTRLECLADRLLDGRIGPAFTGVAAEREGFAEAREFLKSVRGIDPKVIAWALRSIAREREQRDG